MIVCNKFIDENRQIYHILKSNKNVTVILIDTKMIKINYEVPLISVNVILIDTKIYQKYLSKYQIQILS